MLHQIHDPRDVQKLSRAQLSVLCEELRAFLIESVACTGGHFGSNLGVVELTVALHHVFNSPHDQIVWDVGHQAYPHKILTGRKDHLCTIRQKNGLSPFPKREESAHDAFGVGHSTTSISAIVGMALGAKNKKDKHIAVIGDGALTGGMAFEALNHAGDVMADVLVILNDNKMSISPNVGAMHKYLTRLISSRRFQRLRKESKNLLSRKSPVIHEVARRAELYAKGMVTPGTLFEELGFLYFGPIDGHDVETLTEVLHNLKDIKGPRFLHIVTNKGNGYKHAKNDRTSLHAVSPFDAQTGEKIDQKKKVTYTDIFSQWICAVAQKDKRLHAITPAMLEGSGLKDFHQKYPDRHHDVGIAEQHAVTFAAGLATKGIKPVVAIYSTFLQRAYDQLIHDVALQNLDVTFAIDRAGIVGPDGATHAGSFDLSYLRCVPNMIILAPADLEENRAMLQFAYDHEGPSAVRYPRGSGQEQLKNNDKEIALGKSVILRRGKGVAILAFGAMVERCVAVGEEVNATVVNMRFIKPLDVHMIKRLSKTHRYLVTVEDNALIGGAGSAVNDLVMMQSLDVRVCNIGLPDEFLPHGSREEILTEAGLSSDNITKQIHRLMKS